MHSGFYCCEFLRITESQSWKGRLQVDHFPAGISVRSLCSSEERGALTLGWASGTDYSLPSVGSSWACWLWPSSSWQHFKSSNGKLPCHLSITLFQPSHPQFLLFFHLWLDFNHLPFYFWGEAGSSGSLKEVSTIVSNITGHLCWANPHPALWETLPGARNFQTQLIDDLGTSLKTSHGG